MAAKHSMDEKKPKPVNRVADTTSTYPSRTRALLDLSTEVLIKIFAHLPAADLFSAQWTCRVVYDIIAGTAYLRYIMRAHIHGVDDFLPPDFPHSERLELLRRHEQSWSSLQFNRFTGCVISKPYPEHFTLQGGYLIYQRFIMMADTQQYGYIDLCSAAWNEEVHWVNITLESSHLLGFAVDHDLVIAISEQHDVDGIWRRLSFFEFTTGAPHPLSSTHVVSLPPELYRHHVSTAVVGDHILASVWHPSRDAAFYLVSWKTGAVTFLRDFLAIGVTKLGFGELKPLFIESSVLTLMKKSDSIGRLEVCKLEVHPTNPRLKTVCFLELPPSMSGVVVVLSDVITEWVPTSKDYARSRSSRGRHLPFYSSTVRTIALVLDYHAPWETPRSPYKCMIIISVEALLSAIRRGVRIVPWVDWGPTGTHLFEGNPLKPAGPFWVASLSPLVVRQYDLRCTRYTHSMAEGIVSSKTRPQVFSLRGVHAKLREEDRIETNLLFRDLVVNDPSFRRMSQMIADREWVVSVASAGVRGFPFYMP